MINAEGTPWLDDDLAVMAEIGGCGIAPPIAGVGPEIAWAERVVVAAERRGGAVQVDGKMVDRPILAKAERILNRT